MKQMICVMFLLMAQHSYGQTNNSKVPATSSKSNPVGNNGDEVFNYVGSMPRTSYNINQYLAENIHYPDSAIAHNIEGKVIVKFVVNEDGRISDCKVLKGISRECDAEALRVVRKMPPWQPGSQNGKLVKVYFTLPIVYKLTD